eukprot:8903489-Alexandrium_andersonii.AAC.1
MPERASLLDGVKKLNGVDGGGMKLFDKRTSALAGLGITDSASGNNLNDLRDKFSNVRTAARAVILTRSAAMIIKKGRANDVPDLMKEAKMLRVKFDK